MLSTTLDKIREEGIRKGREEGLKEGREEGIKQGKEEGLKELIRAYLLARFGYDIEDLLENYDELRDVQPIEGFALKVYQCQSMDEVDKLLALNPLKLKNMLLSIKDRVIEGGIRQGREEGIKAGREEGIRQGKAEGIREGIKMYLITRFGNAPEGFMEELDKIKDIQALESLASKVYQCQSLDEVGKLLENKQINK